MSIKKKIYLTLFVFLLCFLLALIFIIFPLINQISDKSQLLSEQKSDLAVLEARINNLEKFRELHDDLEYFLAEIDNLFVDSRIPIEFINFLETTSLKCGLEIDILPVAGKESDKELWPYIKFKIVSVGLFPDFLMFLDKLENNPYLIEVKDINVNRLTGEQDELSETIRADFIVQVFVK